MALMAERGERVIAHETIGQRVHISSCADVDALHDDPRIAAWQQTYYPDAAAM
jgi:hypothetical protein